MRIKRIAVEGLFGMFNHVIDMRLESRITIIHGLNGFGKTTVLKMVDGLFHRRYSDLRSTPFKRFEVELEDGISLLVTKTNGEGRAANNKRRRINGIVISQLRRGKEVQRAEFPAPLRVELPSQHYPPYPGPSFEHFIPGVVREAANRWRYAPTNEELDFEDMVDRFAEQMPQGMFHAERPNVEWLKDLCKNVRIRFIESQRLVRLSKAPRRTQNYEIEVPASELSVAVHANELARAIQSKLAEYAALSQSLDRTFPSRLVEQMQSWNPTKQSVSELRDKLNKLEQKRTRLQEAGLLDKQEDLKFQVPENLQEPTQRVLPVYVKDVEQKLGVFDDIAAKIDLLKDIVNSRFSFKNIFIDKEKGFVFRTQNGQPLSPSHLSSGEQHMLVLFSELLFRVEEDSLVMIDEPEISLHVTWQKQFLRDLLRVTELASFDVLIATHSPQIIHDRWDDLTVELESPEPLEQPV